MMQRVLFLRHSSLVLLMGALTIVFTIAIFSLTPYFTASEARDIAGLTIPGMTAYLPSAVAFASGAARPRKGTIWKGHAVIAITFYITYFLFIEAGVVLFATALVELEQLKVVFAAVQTVMGILIGGFFVKELLSASST